MMDRKEVTQGIDEIEQSEKARNVATLDQYGLSEDIFKEDEPEEEIIWVSKSEIKRDAEALKKLGLQLVELPETQLKQFPLEHGLLDAVLLAKRIKKEGRRRQLQLIGKMLRQIDVDPILSAIDKLQNKHNQNVVIFHKLESLRDKLIEQGDDAIELVLDAYPDADRQQLRALVRNAQKERDQNKPPKSARLIYQYLRDLHESQAN